VKVTSVDYGQLTNVQGEMEENSSTRGWKSHDLWQLKGISMEKRKKCREERVAAHAESS
jgi:hypothetical protein